MVQTEKTRTLAQQTIYLVSAHTAFFVLYNYTHAKIDQLFLLTENTPILLIFTLVPLVAALFLSTQSARQAAVVLLGMLPAGLIYNIVIRFTAPAPYSILEPALFWKILYEGSFGIVLVLEVITFWLTFKLLREIHKQLNSSSENPS
jgi:hypothetical protein